jgi:hypothetical protein
MTINVDNNSLRCPIHEHLGSIYRVIKSYHSSIRNAPIYLLHPNTRLSRGHHGLLTFTNISVSDPSQNQWREVGVGHMSRSSGLLRVEASLARVFQSGLKTGGGATTGGAYGTITEVA